MSQHESRWSLAHTGNRVFLAVVVAVAVSCLVGAAGLPTGAQIALMLVVAGLTYLAATLLHHARR